MARDQSNSEPSPSARQLPLTDLVEVLGLTSESGQIASGHIVLDQSNFDPIGHQWIQGITHDSRRVQPGNLYVALPGANFHGAQFAGEVVERGAHAVITDRQGLELFAPLDLLIPVIVVDDPRAVLGQVAAWVYDYPARDLQMIGITGTDGKTTTAMLIEGALNNLGVLTGLVGTIATRVGEWSAPSTRTTPEASDLQALLAFMRDQGAKAAVLEVSSHALELGRADSITFDLAIFTNLGLDHLDFHGTQENYFAAKAKLFSPERAQRAIICANDAWGITLLEQTSLPAEAYVVQGLQAAAWTNDSLPTWKADNLNVTKTGWRFDLGRSSFGNGQEHNKCEAGTRLFGRYNVANATAATAAASWVLANLENATEPSAHAVAQAAQSVAGSPGAPGRMESVDLGQEFTMLVDYAHTPDAVANALASVDELAQSTNGRVICVIGCGGDRDPSKRPTMGQLAAQLSDVAIITDDNPRSEDPAAIRSQIVQGIESLNEDFRASLVEEIEGRPEAIKRAVSLARAGDVVVALGKGHEQGQEINGEILPMDDRELLGSSLHDED